MDAMLRCPSCNEIIRANSTECKYCSTPLSHSAIKTEVANFEDVTNAVSQANTIQTFNMALILVGALCVYLLITGASGLERAYIHFLPLGGFIWVISWFLRFGRLRSKDPDFAPARAGMMRSLVMWGIAVAVYGLCVMYALGR